MTAAPLLFGNLLAEIATLLEPQECAGGFKNTGYGANVYWSITGASAGPTITANKWGAVLLQYVANAGNQSPWNYGRSQRGWSIRYSAADAVQMRMQNAADTTFQYATQARTGGYACLLWNCRNDGSLWSSYCGTPEHLMTLTPSSQAPDATSVQRIGRIAADIGTLAFAGGVLAVAEGTGTLTSAEMAAITNCVNERDRYTFNAALRGRSDLVSELDFGRDWNGSATSVTAGLGSAPRTFAAGPTNGGSKTSIAAAVRYFLMQQRWAARDSKRWDQLATWIRQASFASRSFTTDAADLIVEVLTRSSGENQGYGLYNNGTAVGTGLYSDVVDVSRTVDAPSLGAGNKTVMISDGYQALLTPSSLGWAGEFVRAVRVPSTSRIALTTPDPTDWRLVTYGDSIIGHLEPGSGTITTSAYQAWSRLVWADYPNHAVTNEGYARRTFFDDCSTNSATDAFVDYLLTLLDAVDLGSGAKNQLWVEPSRNDWAFATFNAVSTYKTQRKRFCQRLLDNAPSGLEIYLQTATTCTNEANNNANGYNLPALRTADGEVVTEIGDSRLKLVSGPGLITFNVGNFPDGLHLSVNGHAGIKPPIKTELGYP